MEIVREDHGQVVLVAPGGRLDARSAGDLEWLLDDAWNRGRRHFVLDLAALAGIDSAGLRVLLALLQRATGGGGSVRLCGLDGAVRRAFAMAGMAQAFAVYVNREAALAQHPHRLDAPAALIDAAAGLLGVGAAAALPDPERAAAVAGLLGVSATPADQGG